jgi:hypothetical protein
VSSLSDDVALEIVGVRVPDDADLAGVRKRIAAARAEIHALEAAPVLDPRIRERVESYVASLTYLVHIKGIEAGQPCGARVDFFCRANRADQCRLSGVALPKRGGLPGFDRLVFERAARRHSANVGRAVPQLHQRVGDRPAQLPNRFVCEDRSRVSQPIDADIQDGQRFLQSHDLGLKIFSCLDLAKGVAKPPPPMMGRHSDIATTVDSQKVGRLTRATSKSD